MARNKNSLRLRLGYDVAPFTFGVDFRLNDFRWPNWDLIPFRTLVARFEGGADGRLGLPVSQASRTEGDIEGWYRDRRNKILNWLDSRCSTTDAVVERYAPLSNPDEQWNRDCIDLALDAVYNEEQPKFRKNNASVRNARGEIESFKTAYGVTRDPRVPNIPEAATWLVGIWIVEVAFGTQLFAQGTDRWDTAAAYAMMFSGGNIVFGLILGHFGVAYARHPKGWRRYVGAPVLLIGVPLTLLFNIVLGHIRDAFADPANAAQAGQLLDPVAESLRQGLIHYTSVEAVLLVVLGVVVLGLSIWRGYSGIMDPIPEYDWRHRMLTAAEEEQERNLESAQKSINKVADDLASELQRGKVWHESAIAFFKRLKAFVLRHCGWVPSRARQLADQANRRRSAYRGANLRNRARKQLQGDHPAHFNDVIDTTLELGKVQEVIEKIDTTVTHMTANIQVIERCARYLAEKTKLTIEKIRAENSEATGFEPKAAAANIQNG